MTAPSKNTGSAANGAASKDYRRMLVGVCSLVLLAGYLFGQMRAEDSGFKLLAEMLGRIGRSYQVRALRTDLADPFQTLLLRAAGVVAAGHVLPDQQAHAVAVPVPPLRLHLDVLADHIEAKSLGDFDEALGEEQREISSTSRNTEA